MQVPLQIAFEHIPHSDPIERRIREEVEKFEEFYGRITSARVVLCKPQHRHHTGDTYAVRIHLAVPDAADIVINRNPAVTGVHEDAYVTIRDAFKAARHQLQDLVRERQGQTKAHESAPHGTIASLHPGADHGFITSADGREIYFHRNSVEADKFDDLEAGQEVRFSEAAGDKGPQATLVRPLGKHHVA